MTRTIKRDIALITAELQIVLKRETADIIAIGDLLNEAKEQLDHGKWLPWLDENFGATSRVAENYMIAARFAAKFEPGSNLKLRANVLYLLGREMDTPDGLYSPKAIAAILKAAETGWVNETKAREIAISLRAPPPPPPPPKSFKEIEAERVAREAQRAAAERAEQEEADDIIDGPPPELPPAPGPTAHDVVGPAFDQAVRTLLQLQTKPLASFAGTTHPGSQIRAVSVFLREVADAIETGRAPLQETKAPSQPASSTPALIWKNNGFRGLAAFDQTDCWRYAITPNRKRCTLKRILDANGNDKTLGIFNDHDAAKAAAGADFAKHLN